MKYHALMMEMRGLVLATIGALAGSIEVPFKTIAKGQFCDYVGEDNYVLSDETSFKERMAKAGIIV